MKSIHAAIAAAATLALAFILAAALVILPERLLFDGAECYRFYVGNTSLDCKEVFADSVSAPLVRLTLSNLSGESATYTSLDIACFLQDVDGEIIFTEEVDGTVNYYCRADLPYSVTLYGTEINLHICIKESGVTVASPIIFGGY